jgi:photosystem II stability/assembly factor-like uncharacterized protein
MLRIMMLAVLSLLVVVVPHVTAQTDTAGRWRRVDIRVEGPLPRPPFVRQDLRPVIHFASPSVGYAMIPAFNHAHTEGIDTQRFEIVLTTDGGSSWTHGDSTTPRPRRILGDGFGVAENGFVTYDGGGSWQPLPMRSDISSITSIDAASRTHIAMLYRTPAAPVDRLAYTTDGGARWTHVDTVVHTIQRPALGPATTVGRFPGGSPTNLWGATLQFVDEATIIAVTLPGAPTNGEWMARIDPGSGRASWTQLPLAYREQFRLLQFVDSATGFLVRDGGVVEGPDYYGHTLLGTRDGGLTWDSLSASFARHAPGEPDEMPRLGTLRMLSRSYGVTDDAYTLDGGRTWTVQASNPFGVARYKYELLRSGVGVGGSIIDSLHRLVAERWGLFARSSDGGRTWRRSAAAGHARAVAARGEHVMVAREYQSLAVSEDAGLTWRDVGVDGGLPGDLRMIHEITYADSTSTDHLFAIADFVARDRPMRFGIIESTDGGMTWGQVGSLPDRMGFGGIVEDPPVDFRDIHLQLRRDAGGRQIGFATTAAGLYVSDDAGRTWSRRDSALRVVQLSMADADHGIVYTRGYGSNERYRVLATSDRGLTWRRLEVPATFDYAFADGGTVYLHASTPEQFSVYHVQTGRPSVIRISWTLDAGATWQQDSAMPHDQYSTIRDFYHQLRFIDSTVYAISARGAIARAPLSSTDFVLLRDVDASDPDIATPPPFYQYMPPVALSTDERFIYIAGGNDAVGRFTLRDVVAGTGRAIEEILRMDLSQALPSDR